MTSRYIQAWEPDTQGGNDLSEPRKLEQVMCVRYSRKYVGICDVVFLHKKSDKKLLL